MPRKRKEIVQLIQQAGAQKWPTLNLSHGQIEELLEPVWQMDWLTELDLSHGHLGSLPEAIGNLTNLTRLVLSENQLATLPESITRLTALHYLDLDQAGYGFTLYETVVAWLETLPEVHWPQKPVVEETPIGMSADHPNQFLEQFKYGLKLYGDALSMEDHSYNGSETRAKADAIIEQVFRQMPELKEVLPEFYRDFQEHRFYGTTCDSEKSLDDNPFRLPTKEDDRWLADVPLRLRADIDQRRHVFALNPRTGQETEVFCCEYGGILVSNQPSAPDDSYFADCEAWLYQAGARRFYVRAVVYGYGGASTAWYVSSDDGQTWQRQARLTEEWLEKTVPAGGVWAIFPAVSLKWKPRKFLWSPTAKAKTWSV